jgi:Protein of unknown function (DUF3098)
MAKQPAKGNEKQVKKTATTTQNAEPQFLFGKRNYMFLFLGIAILAIGFLLMTGGAQPPTQFDPNVVYSFRRTTLSTIFVTLGFLVVLYSIFVKHTATEQS